MPTINVEEFLGRLHAGQQDRSDEEMLERASANDLIAQLETRHPWTFQERRVGEKSEIGMAGELRQQLVSGWIPRLRFPLYFPVLVFQDCLFASAENDVITGIAWNARFKVKPVGRSLRRFALITSEGYKLDRMPDGWVLKKLHRRKVLLADSFLTQRGFRFESFWNVPAKP